MALSAYTLLEYARSASGGVGANSALGAIPAAHRGRRRGRRPNAGTGSAANEEAEQSAEEACGSSPSAAADAGVAALAAASCAEEARAGRVPGEMPAAAAADGDAATAAAGTEEALGEPPAMSPSVELCMTVLTTSAPRVQIRISSVRELLWRLQWRRLEG
jgi:hypothetical protein